MSVEKTLAERGKRYGDFADHAKIAQNIKRGMQCSGYDDLPDMHRQALEVIADKIARILSGDPNYADNWHDIQGYAKLVEDRLPVEVPADFGQQHTIEPAAAIDDESPRMQAIGQNGNSGEHYDAEKLERWKDAPEWATHIVSRDGVQEFARLSHGRYYDGRGPDTWCMSFIMADADPSGWTVLEARP